MAGLNLTVVSEQDENSTNPDATQAGDIDTSKIDKKEERSLLNELKLPLKQLVMP